MIDENFKTLPAVFSMNFEKYISFTSTYKITKQKRELLPEHERESAPKFPNIMVCNYQAHSRLLLKRNYPMMTMRRTLDLYKVSNLESFLKYNHIKINVNLTSSAQYDFSMKQLQHDTPSEILHIACQMGTEDCASRWQPVMTPNGMCNVLYMNHLRRDQAESTLRKTLTF